MPKISALTSLAQADVVTTTDVLPIVDATAPATTKKVTVQAMVNAGLATLTTLPSGIVNASLNSITPTGGTLGVTGIQTITANSASAGLTVAQSGAGPAAIFKTGTNQNIWLRPASTALNTLTGPALSGINDAASALTDLTFQGAKVNVVIDNTLRGQWTSSGMSVTGSLDAVGTLGTVSTGAEGIQLAFTRAGVNYISAPNGSMEYDGSTHIFKSADQLTTFATINSTGISTPGAISATGTIGSSNALETLNSGSLYQYNAGSTTFFRSRNDGNNLDVSYNGGGVITRTNTSGFAVTGSISATSLVDISAAGAGQIKFPATQNASADANTLDDYEEGSWTPTITFGGASTGVTYSTQGGSYTKVGNRVTVSGYVALTNKGSATGAAAIGGLPFTVGAGSGAYAIPGLFVDVITFTGIVQGITDPASTSILFGQSTEAGAYSALTDANFANNSSIAFSLTYKV